MVMSEVMFIVSVSVEKRSMARRMEEMESEWETAAEMDEQGRSIHPHVSLDDPAVDTIITDWFPSDGVNRKWMRETREEEIWTVNTFSYSEE